MDPTSFRMFMASPPSGSPAIGDSYGGGLVGAYISYNADGVATHGLIVGPESSTGSGGGYTTTTNLQWATSSFSVTTDNVDGATNTSNIIAAASTGQAPAAEFCAGLTVGGYSDWYLPSQTEQQILYHHCKPTTNGNNFNRGSNAYAIPPRTSNYDAETQPSQSSISAFQSGGTHAWPDEYHWTSYNVFGSSIRLFIWSSGFDANSNNTSTRRTRAIRKFSV